MINKKALQILFDTYWSNSGWVKNPYVSPEDFAYAKDAGMMFEHLNLSHDTIVQWLVSSKDRVSIEDISNAFLSSLGTRRLDLRSALGSYAVALNFQKHEFEGTNACSICGSFQVEKEPYDLNPLSFERYKWGGVRHSRPEYIAFDLECFAKSTRVKPTESDLEVMMRIIETVNQCSISERPNDLERKLSKVLKSNKNERRTLVEILSYCGILKPKKYPSFFDFFIKKTDRIIPNYHKVDWAYPVCWWRGIDGLNEEALAFYFPQILER